MSGENPKKLKFLCQADVLGEVLIAAITYSHVIGEVEIDADL